MKMFEPKVRIPGAQRKEIPNPALKNVFEGVDTSNIPETIMVWDKPPHDSLVNHFVNAAAKRMFLAGEIDAKDAFSRVKVYRGMDNKTFKRLQQNFKYAQKLASEEWKAGTYGKTA